MRRLALAVALLAGSAAAQTTPLLPGVSADQREQFRLCRAAVFYHLDPAAEARSVPKAMAEAMREQIDFIMYETLRRGPGASVADAGSTIDFAENFFLSFSVTVAGQQRLRTDTETREETLIGCIPLVWMIAKEEIDGLMVLRERMKPR